MSVTADPAVTIDGVSVAFGLSTPLRERLHGHRRVLHAVRDVDLTVGRGSALGIVGESGSGKTTLAKVICGLVEPTTGSIRIVADRPAGGPPPVQMIFQDPTSSLDPRQTASAAVSEMLRVHQLVPHAQISRRCDELLTMVGLPPAARSARPSRLSGGQRQRVAIARALALEPSVLIADEAVASLDVSVKAGVLNLLRDLQRRLGLTLIMITHDLATVRHITDEVAVMYLGSIVERGPVGTVMAAPRHPYTRALLSAVPRLHDEPVEPNRGLPGDPPNPMLPPSGCPFHPRCTFAQPDCRRHRPPLVQVGNRKVACPVLAPPH